MRDLETPEVMTAIEVARELRVSKAHVHNLINGKVTGVPPIPFIPMGRRRVGAKRERKESLVDSEDFHICAPEREPKPTAQPPSRRPNSSSHRFAGASD